MSHDLGTLIIDLMIIPFLKENVLSCKQAINYLTLKNIAVFLHAVFKFKTSVDTVVDTPLLNEISEFKTFKLHHF